MPGEQVPSGPTCGKGWPAELVRADGCCTGRQVCECVVILRNLKDVSWAGAKLMMADTQFLRSLVEFDKDSLSEKQACALGRRAACAMASGCHGTRQPVHPSRGARMPGMPLGTLHTWQRRLYRTCTRGEPVESNAATPTSTCFLGNDTK